MLFYSEHRGRQRHTPSADAKNPDTARSGFLFATMLGQGEKIGQGVRPARKV